MVAVIVPFVVLVAVKAGVFPVPEAANPMAVLELVQVIVPPVGLLIKVLVGTKVPTQIVLFCKGVTIGDAVLMRAHDGKLSITSEINSITKLLLEKPKAPEYVQELFTGKILKSPHETSAPFPEIKSQAAN